MPTLLSSIRWGASRLALALVGLAVIDRARSTWRRRREATEHRRHVARAVLPSLYDRVPGASTAPRRRLGYRTVPLDRIVGTLRHPSQNTADFLPLPRLRGRNWEARWQRILRAMNRMEMLPPVDLVKAGDDYYVEDGHNRVGAAQQLGVVEIDADVVELQLPGHRASPLLPDAGALLGTEEVRQAGSGRLSRTAEIRSATDELSRDQLARSDLATPRADPDDESPGV